MLGRWSSWHYRCRARRGSTLLFREREPYKIRRLYHAQHLSGNAWASCSWVSARFYILREVTPPRVFRRQSGGPAVMVVPALLVATGLVLTVIITLRLNPWTGALWMIWTFILIVVVVARTTSSPNHNRATAVAQHRFGTSCLAAFSWWGALQGFGPAYRHRDRGRRSNYQRIPGQPAWFVFASVFSLPRWLGTVLFPCSTFNPPLHQAASHLTSPNCLNYFSSPVYRIFAVCNVAILLENA